MVARRSSEEIWVNPEYGFYRQQQTGIVLSLSARFYRLPPIVTERTSKDNCIEESLTAGEEDGAESEV
jgi:hypothetical protein